MKWCECVCVCIINLREKGSKEEKGKNEHLIPPKDRKHEATVQNTNRFQTDP